MFYYIENIEQQAFVSWKQMNGLLVYGTIGIFQSDQVAHLASAQFGPDNVVADAQDLSCVQRSRFRIQHRSTAQTRRHVQARPHILRHIVRFHGRTIDNWIRGVTRQHRSEAVRPASHSNEHQPLVLRLVFAYDLQRVYSCLVSRRHTQLGGEPKRGAMLGDFNAVLLVASATHQYDDQVVGSLQDVIQLLRDPNEIIFDRFEIGLTDGGQVAVHLLVLHQTLVAGRPQTPRVRVDDVSHDHVAC